MTGPIQATCPVCNLMATIEERDHGEQLHVKCPSCGKFAITKTAERQMQYRRIAPKLSAWLRSNDGCAHLIDKERLEIIESGFPSYGVKEKVLLLMRYLEKASKHPGSPIIVGINHDAPVAWAENENEFYYLLRTLIERNLIARTDEGPIDLKDDFVFEFIITASGWDFLEQHARAGVIGTQAFVAMSFSKEMKPIWLGPITNALRRAGFNPYRIDDDKHLERIDVKLMAEIKNSRFVVADFTKQRQSVYFEAGYAMGLGIPVFWCVKDTDKENIHFDTRQYSHIVWIDSSDLEEQLYDSVRAIIGKP